MFYKYFNDRINPIYAIPESDFDVEDPYTTGVSRIASPYSSYRNYEIWSVIY